MVNLPVLTPVCSKNSYPADPIPICLPNSKLPCRGRGSVKSRVRANTGSWSRCGRKRQGGESSGWRQAWRGAAPSPRAVPASLAQHFLPHAALSLSRATPPPAGATDPGGQPHAASCALVRFFLDLSPSPPKARTGPSVHPMIRASGAQLAWGSGGLHTSSEDKRWNFPLSRPVFCLSPRELYAVSGHALARFRSLLLLMMLRHASSFGRTPAQLTLPDLLLLSGPARLWSRPHHVSPSHSETRDHTTDRDVLNGSSVLPPCYVQCCPWLYNTNTSGGWFVRPCNLSFFSHL
jgi:hypothetical protein